MSVSGTDQRSGGTNTRRKPQQARPRLAMRLLARRVHFLAGILVAPFIAVVCLTGLLFVATPQIHDSLYHGNLYVGQHSGVPHPIPEQIAAGLTAHPEAAPQSVITPAGPYSTTRIVLPVAGRPTARTAVRFRRSARRLHHL